MVMQRSLSYIKLMRLNKPIGILLLLWPTLWALWLAGNGKPHLHVITVFIAGVILMRSAGCIMNDFADRDFDSHVQRTADRPLATGSISTTSALIVFSILCLIALGLVLTLNIYTILLSIPGMLLAITYPFMKRYTHLPQVGLGFAFSWGIPMAFAAETNSIPYGGWMLYITAIVWPVIYDTMYAMTDKEDDLKIGLKSTAILFAKLDKFIIGLLQIIFLIGLGVIGYIFHLNVFYFASLLAVSGFFGYQQWLIKERNPVTCFEAFLNNQWVGLLIFMGIVFGVLT